MFSTHGPHGYSPGSNDISGTRARELDLVLEVEAPR